MDVLMLTREYPPHVYGGAGVVVDELSRALARRGHVEVRCFGSQQAERPGLSVRGHEPWDRLGASGQRYAPALEALSVNLAMVAIPPRADVVHAHTWYVGIGGVLARQLFDIPLVVTLHSLEPLRPWKEAQLGSGYAVSSWAERAAVETADRVVAVSARMREDVLAHFAVDPARVAVVGNGVDADVYRRTAARETLARHRVREPYVLFVGRISEQKGIFTLLAAADGLHENVQVVLCAAAPDTPELEARLRAEAARRPGVVWIPAMLPREEVIELLSHAALFVAPSVYEPFGIMNLEAMACATPVVSTAVGGIPDVVVHGETGLLVPPGDVAALAEAMRALLADSARAAAMGRAGRQRVEAHFSWDRIASLTAAVYAEAIATYRASSRK
ncbi:MAG TPA: glycogen synthase [Candidatus Binatia bacterium]|nr:glycogen synthase [Candidatus Binatia bacterium]